MIKVLVVESRRLNREGLYALLSRESDITIVNGVEQRDEIVDQIQAISPDAVVIAPKPSDGDCFTLIRQMKRHLPGLPVVVLAEPWDQEALLPSIKAGAAAYLTKDASPEELMDAIRRTSRGEYLINDTLSSNPRVASRILDMFGELTLSGAGIEPFLAPLSQREIDVLNLIAGGNSNKQIAHELFISEQTVKNHVASIMRKLVANDRTHAVAIAFRQGLIRWD